MGQVIPDELTGGGCDYIQDLITMNRPGAGPRCGRHQDLIGGGVLVIACIAAEMLMPYSNSAGCALVRWARVGQRLGTSA
jgi:hypothetical protein